MKQIAVVLLLLGLIAVALPFGTGMDGMAFCPKCTEGISTLISMCMAILASIFFAINLSLFSRVSVRFETALARGRPRLILRPPR